MKTQSLKSLNRSELKDYVFEIQDHIDGLLQADEDIDNFLDNTDIFDEFEKVLPDEEYGIFVITMLNKIRTDYIIERLLDVVEGSQNKSNGSIPKS